MAETIKKKFTPVVCVAHRRKLKAVFHCEDQIEQEKMFKNLIVKDDEKITAKEIKGLIDENLAYMNKCTGIDIWMSADWD